MKAQLTAQQFAALALVELAQHTLAGAAAAVKGLGAPVLEAGVVAAIGALRKAHEDYFAETQRAVSIAAPGDLAKLVAAP